jgi:hypothetical protein
MERTMSIRDEAELVCKHLEKLGKQEMEIRATRNSLISDATDIILASNLTTFEKFLIWKDCILPHCYKEYEDVYESDVSTLVMRIEDDRDLTLLAPNDAAYRRMLFYYRDYGVTAPEVIDNTLLKIMKAGKDHVFET